MKSYKLAPARRRVSTYYFTRLILLFLLFSVALAACGDSTATPEKPGAAATSENVVRFGAVLSLTGSLKDESRQVQQGYDLWKETVNEKGGIQVGDKRFKIEIKYYDDESRADKSGQFAATLINQDKVSFLLGPYGSANTQAVAKVAEESGVLLVEGNGAAEQIFQSGKRFTFGVMSPASRYLQGALEMAFAQDPRPRSLAILAASDSFSKEVALAARRFAESKKVEVALYEEYTDKSTNLTSQVNHAQAAKPDLLINSGHFSEAAAILKAAKELNFNPQAFIFTVGPGLPEWSATLKGDANFTMSGAQWTSNLPYKGDDVFGTPANFLQAFQKRWNTTPSYQGASGAACGVAYQKAIEKAASLETFKVKDALMVLDFMSFYGQIKFDERGMNIFKPMAVEQWQNGKKVTVWPVEVAEAKPVWPTPPWDKRN